VKHSDTPVNALDECCKCDVISVSPVTLELSSSFRCVSVLVQAMVSE